MDQGTESLLGEGMDLTGATVSYWGQIWTVVGKNYLGDWGVVRYEQRGDEVIRIGSSIAPNILPAEHPHYAELVPGPCPFCGSKESLHPQILPTTTGEPWKSVICISCGAVGPMGKSPEKAISLWSQRPETKRVIKLDATLRETEDSARESISKLTEALEAMLTHYGPDETIAHHCKYSPSHPLTLARKALGLDLAE